MSDQNWDQTFDILLREALPSLPPGTISPGDNLSSAGLDSLASVQLLLELEAAYGISIPDEELDWKMFGTPGSLWAVVQAHRDTDRLPR